MADTRRSLSDLLTNLFQDGQSEGITAQDVRDLLVSVQPPHGDCYVSAPAATAIGVAGTFVKAAGTTTFHDDSIDFDSNSANNRLRYTGAPTCHAHVHGQISLTSDQNNRVVTIAIYHYDASAASGSVQAKGKAKVKIGTGTDVVTIPIHTDVHLDTNDYLEIWITDEDGTANITATEMYLAAVGSLV